VGQHQRQPVKASNQSSPRLNTRSAGSHARSRTHQKNLVPSEVSLIPRSNDISWDHGQMPSDLSGTLYQVTRWGLIVGSGFIMGVLLTMWLLS